MHGNTSTKRNGQKTKACEDIVAEIKYFWQIHTAEGTVAAGVNLELTRDNVIESIGGNRNLNDNDLYLNYQTLSDPRLNAEKTVEITFKIAFIINPI